MLQSVAPVLGSKREKELTTRLRSNPDAVLAAEWEIAVVYCLSKQGRIESLPSKHGVGESDIVYTSQAHGSRVAVEATAVSDASFEAKNPVRAFADELLRVTLKHGIHHLGGIRYDIGHATGKRGPVLAVPPRQETSRFFASDAFLAFVSEIKSAPLQPCRFRFGFHGAESTLDFEPGKATGAGGHIMHNLPFDVSHNPIASRLKTKDRQIAKIVLDLPSVVVLCDGDSAAFSEPMGGSSALTAQQIVDVFLNGYPNDKTGLWLNTSPIRPESRRINGVTLWTVREDFRPWTGEPSRRYPAAQVVMNRATTYHPLDRETLDEIADSIRHLPRFARMPLNARRRYPLPEFYGGYRLFGASPVKIRMSLLTLQHVLSGRIPFDKFSDDNDDLVAHLKRMTDRGLMISKIEVTKCPDHDDDWVEFHLEEVAPTHLLADDGGNIEPDRDD